MINEEPTMSVGTGGFTSAAPATGPNAGLDPMLGKGKVRRKKKKEECGCQHEETDRHNHTPNRLLQYKVNIPNVGETVIYASSPAELMQKLRHLVNPRYHSNITIERIMPGEAAKFFMDKRMKHMRNIDESADQQMQQQMAQNKAQMLKKQTDLKKQELQKALQRKLANIKQKARVGADVTTAAEEYLPESSGGNIDTIKKIAQGKEPGMLQFQKGGQTRMSPQLAKKIWDAYEALGKQKNRAKFSNAANESESSFQRILNFVGKDGEQ